MKNVLVILVGVLAALPVSAVAQGARDGATEVAEREAYVMGTRLGAEVWGPGAAEAAEAALAAVRGVEDRLSTWREGTELSEVNAAPVGAARAVTPELLALLAELDGWVTATGGAFDPAVGALVEAWGLREGGRIPAEAELASARSAGWTSLELDREAGTVTRGAESLRLDAGAFGKGVGLREAGSALRAAGVGGVLNFGGQVYAVAAPTRIGIAHPERRAESVLELELRDASASTTSNGERVVEADGRDLGHVLDPRTGRPVEAWGSVTVVSEDPMVADLLSTALFVMGPEAALAWSADRPEGVVVVPATGSPRWNRAMERWLVAPTPSVTGSGAAAQDTIDVARLKRQVDAITRELERLRLGGDVVTQADTGILGFGPAASKIYKVDRGVSIGGYGEVLYRMVDDELEDGTESPTANQFDALRAILYVGYKFSDKVLVNTEIEIEHGDEAYLEFAYLDYRVSDALGFRGGLLLSPMGLVNELHEPPVFLGTTRPLVESRIIPTTWRENGLGVFGDVGSISYRAYVMNGLEGVNFSAAGLRGGRQKGSKALAEDLAGVVRADYTGVPGLLAGGSVYYGGSGQNVTTPSGAEVQANTMITEVHASYQARGLDLRGLVASATVDEAAELNAAGADGVAEWLTGAYAHVGYDVLRGTGSSHQLFPYVRYEWLDTRAEPADGEVATGVYEEKALLVGASWKPVPQVAVKGDYQFHWTDAETGRNQLAFVISYLF